MEQDNKKNEIFEDKNAEKKTKNTENNEREKEIKTITLTQEDYDNIKLQVADAMNDYKDLERDFENYRSRLKDEVEKAKFEGVSDAVKTILPALDSFKKARKIVQDKATLSGIHLIEKNVLSALDSLGIKKIDCVGKAFDPNFHNAVMMMQKEHTKSGTVIDEVEAGYMLKDKVIKYSQVIVAK
ncbi:MAG: nucleotide exchange factor GrpE [Clostridia bacterium]|nr:nucleotide exchange factor GrpE [Clostridia bacterium]